MAQFPDKRTGKTIQYRMEDVALGAFSVFFTQSPSFLAFQTVLKNGPGCSNAETLFGITEIPTDNHIRDLLDAVPPEHVFPMFDRVIDAINEQGQLQSLLVLDGQLLIALDGTQYHTSSAIHCEQCSVKQHRNGNITYSHAVVTPVIVAPKQGYVLPLTPEFITPQDGHDKQDCENAAAKRWIDRNAERYPDHSITLLGDDLYSHQPLCEQVLGVGWNFIFVAKSSSHTTLYAQLQTWAENGSVQSLKRERRQGKRLVFDTYRFANRLPLRDSPDALKVNWCALTTTDADGKVLYLNSFITNFSIDAKNVEAIVEAGRTRWKVENENNNTLKTKGYHLTHNFGHGKKYLAATLATLNLLAFLFHTVLDRMDSKYQLIRAKLPCRKIFFQHVQALTCYLCFDNFDALMNFMMQALKITPPETSQE